MAYRELVKEWHRGVLALEKGNWESALRIFGCIENPSSKIDFNIGCVHLRAFERTVSKDRCLAVGFYQRGYVCLRLERYEEALNDFRLALTHLRKNACIDYKQLGLKVVLCVWEVLYNTAAAHCRLGNWQDAWQTLEEAIGQDPKGQNPHLDGALERVQKQVFLEPRSIPQGEFFRPQKKDVDELESKDFLGQPKVISSAFEDDTESGFPRVQQSQGSSKPGEDPSSKGDHGSLGLTAPYSPEENGLKTASTLQASSAGLNSHTTGFNERRKVGPGLPLPPGKVAPSQLHERQKVQLPELAERKIDQEDANSTHSGRALESSLALEDIPPTQREDPRSDGDPILLKVHGSYVMNIKLSIAPSLSDLRALLQEECHRQAQQMTLGYKSPGSNELTLIHSDEELRNVWQGAEGRHLTLWSQSQGTSANRPVLYQMLARHSYTAQGPEDLNFKEGDKLDILSEVNEEWLEGRCDGSVGIFPKCFAARDGASKSPS
ncbi:NADPH oxidase activator 1 [Tiliqua scincoides]|uniref:NADPH oxidase activator 1 n=1 Tax=Tiliqua scincoides TaxID=71010 RepID=UPI0034621130